LNNNSNNNSNNLKSQQIELNENNPNILNQNNKEFNSKNQNFNYNTNKDFNHEKFENKKYNVNDEANKRNKEKNDNNNQIDKDFVNDDKKLNNSEHNLEQNQNKIINNSEESNTNIENKKNNVIEVNNKNNEYNDELEIIGVDKRKTKTSNRKKNTKNNNKKQTRINNKKTNKRKRKDKEIIEEDNSITKRIKSFNIEDIIDTASNLTICIPTESFNYNDVSNKYDKDEWLKAVEEELNNIKELNVYTIVDHVPKNANIITPKEVFKYKLDASGSIVKRKARLVARGFTQIYGIDFTVTFSPTLRQDSLRLVTAIAAKNKYNIYQIDVKAAYLNAELEDNIYIKVP